eukprot:8803577-Pyramimonas_sp.AAC.1
MKVGLLRASCRPSSRPACPRSVWGGLPCVALGGGAVALTLRRLGWQIRYFKLRVGPQGLAVDLEK